MNELSRRLGELDARVDPGEAGAPHATGDVRIVQMFESCRLTGTGRGTSIPELR